MVKLLLSVDGDTILKLAIRWRTRRFQEVIEGLEQDHAANGRLGLWDGGSMRLGCNSGEARIEKKACEWTSIAGRRCNFTVCTISYIVFSCV